MFIVVTYDIVDDKIRTRLFKLLKRYGDRVQYSIFECEISPDQFRKMRDEIADIISGDDGDLRYYEVCAECRRRIMSFGRAVTITPQRSYIV